MHRGDAILGVQYLGGPLQTVIGGYVIEKSLVDPEQFDTLLRLAGQSLPAWAEEERARHATRVTEASILAAESATALLELGETVTWSNVVRLGDQLNERSWTALILALELAGCHSEGLQACECCRRILNQELGCAPRRSLPRRATQDVGDTADGEFSEVVAALLVVHGRFAISPTRMLRCMSPSGRDGVNGKRGMPTVGCWDDISQRTLLLVWPL